MHGLPAGLPVHTSKMLASALFQPSTSTGSSGLARAAASARKEVGKACSCLLLQLVLASQEPEGHHGCEICARKFCVSASARDTQTGSLSPLRLSSKLCQFFLAEGHASGMHEVGSWREGGVLTRNAPAYLVVALLANKGVAGGLRLGCGPSKLFLVSVLRLLRSACTPQVKLRG